MSAQGQAYIPDHKIDEVRLASDIVQVVGQRVRLTKKGRDYWGLCPFHGDKDPSFKVDRERGTWYCFGCGEGGSIFNFLMKDEGLSFPEAVRELAGRFGVELPKPELSQAQRQQQKEREGLLGVMQKAQEYFTRQFRGAGGQAARDYVFKKRGLSSETAEAFGLGFAPDQWEGLGRFLAGQGVSQELAIKTGLLVPRDKGQGCYDRFRGRVVFPIRDAAGRIISFGGRILGDGEPKYLNGPESPLFNKSAALYNLDGAKRAMHQKGRALVVEGYFDVITCAQYGFAETVAPMGTALTPLQVRILRRQAEETVLVFDGDQAGIRAATRALPIFQEAGGGARVLLLPSSEDPDSFLRGQGPQALERAVEEARPLVEMVLDRMVAQGETSTAEGSAKVVAAAAPVIKALKDPVTAWLYLEHLARSLKLPPEVVAKRLGMPLPGRRSAAPRAPEQGRGGDCLGGSETCLLEQALAFSESARRLRDSGALARIKDPRLRQVARALEQVLDQGLEVSPAAVSQALEDQNLAPLVVELAQHAPRLAEDEARSDSGRTESRLLIKRLEDELASLKKEIAGLPAEQKERRLQLQQERIKINKHIEKLSTSTALPTQIKD